MRFCEAGAALPLSAQLTSACALLGHSRNYSSDIKQLLAPAFISLAVSDYIRSRGKPNKLLDLWAQMFGPSTNALKSGSSCVALPAPSASFQFPRPDPHTLCYIKAGGTLHLDPYPQLSFCQLRLQPLVPAPKGWIIPQRRITAAIHVRDDLFWHSHPF